MTQIDDLILRWLRVTPDRPAVWSSTTTLTFGELDLESAKVADAIMTATGDRARTVIVAMSRSVELVVGIVAVLRLGGTYCPVEPDEPVHRRRAMLAAAEPDVVLTVPGELSWRDELDTPVVDIELGNAGAQPQIRRREVAMADAPYVLFTSGSTGTPKGVLGTHEAITTRLAWMNEHYPLAGDDVFVFKTATTFVDSVWDLCHPLSTGHGLLVLSRAEVRDPALFVRRLAEHRVTRLSIVPSHLDVLLTAFPDLGTRLPSVRLLDVTGEAFSAALLERAKVAFGDDVVLLNRYGTTEAPSALCFDARSHRTEVHGDQVSIGGAITGSQAWLGIGDSVCAPCPGLSGELCLAGAQLARGYLDAQLTEQRFVERTIEGRGTERVYRTGDVVTVVDDGSLCFGGRTDWQVQVGGKRVDLEEVRAVLLRHAAVTQAVATVSGESPEVTLQAAFVATEPVEPHELRRFLGDHLPTYMVPATLRQLDALPTLPSGKTDRLAVAELLRTMAVDVTTEDLLAVVSALLSDSPADPIGGVSANVRLLGLGFDSLRAMRLVVEVQRRWGLEVTPGFVLGSSADDLVALLNGRTPDPGRVPARRPIEHSAGAVAPMSRQQELFHRIDRDLGPDRHAYHDLWTIRLTGQLRADLLLHSAQQLAVCHSVFRTGLSLCGGMPCQEVMAEPVVDAELHDLSGFTDAEMGRRIREITAAAKRDRYDLAAGESLRVRVLRLSADQHVLALATHHVTNDAWSGGLLNRTLSETYRALHAGHEPPGPGDGHTYADYATWQADAERARVFEPQVAYWTRRLTGIGPTPTLLPHSRDGVEPNLSGDTASVELPPGMAAAVRAAAAAAGIGEFAYYLTGYAVLLAHALGTYDGSVVIGSPTALRHYPELTDTVGLFANMLAYRIDVSPIPASELLDQVNETCLAALANQEAPFLTVAERLCAGAASGHPLTKVTFAMPDVRERFGAAIRLPEVVSHPEDVTPLDTMSKFDLSLFVHTGHPAERLVAVYRRHAFTRATVVSLLNRYLELLNGFLHAPHDRPRSGGVLAPAERA